MPHKKWRTFIFSHMIKLKPSRMLLNVNVSTMMFGYLVLRMVYLNWNDSQIWKIFFVLFTNNGEGVSPLWYWAGGLGHPLPSGGNLECYSNNNLVRYRYRYCLSPQPSHTQSCIPHPTVTARELTYLILFCDFDSWTKKSKYHFKTFFVQQNLEHKQ